MTMHDAHLWESRVQRAAPFASVEIVPTPDAPGVSIVVEANGEPYATLVTPRQARQFVEDHRR